MTALNSVSTSELSTLLQKPKYLDPSQRPESLQARVDASFKNIVGCSTSSWGLYNGNSNYNLCGVKEYEAMKKLILKDYPSRKEFYALDIGAGNFQFNKGLAEYLNKQDDLPNDITIHIIGVRGESNDEYKGAVTTGRCKMYNLGAFKTEEIFEQFKDLGFDLKNKLDLVVSHFCFRHFADPVGTFVQTYNLLRPNSGLILLDGFNFLYESDHPTRVDFNKQMTQLFLDTGAPFLIRPHSFGGSLNHFILQRPSGAPCQLSMSYVGSKYSEDPQIGSHTVTEFKRIPQPSDKQKLHLPKETEFHQMRGDKKLHDWLKENRLLSDDASTWAPLQEKDERLKNPRLHEAIIKKDQGVIASCLENCSDINESDSEGDTALHLALRQQNFELAEQLLSKGADVGLFNAKGLSPIHEAAISDQKGTFLEKLIKAGADLNIHANRHSVQPIDAAIQSKNLKAIELLLKAKVKVSFEAYTQLQKNEFSSIHSLLPKMPHESEDFEKIMEHISNGDCVLLHYKDRKAGFSFQQTASQSGIPSSKKIVIVDVNRETELLSNEFIRHLCKRAKCEYNLEILDELSGFTEKSEMRLGY